MTLRQLTEHKLVFLSFKGGCTSSSESTHAKCHIVGNHMSRLNFSAAHHGLCPETSNCKEHLAIRRIFSLVDMTNNIKFSNCPNVFEIGVVWQ